MFLALIFHSEKVKFTRKHLSKMPFKKDHIRQLSNSDQSNGDISSLRFRSIVSITNGRRVPSYTGSPRSGNTGLDSTNGFTSAEPQPANITSLAFEPSGRYLAYGDVFGRVTVLNTKTLATAFDYKSHAMQFDVLKSQQIDEKINFVHFLPSISPTSTSLLVANEKVVKLWRLHGNGGSSLRKSFVNHSCAINALSVAADGQYFASSDDLKVEYWHLEHPEKSLNVVDIKPADMEDLTEVITSISFHPNAANMMAMSSSKGCAYIADVREQSHHRNKNFAMSFTAPRTEADDDLADVLASISDVTFDGSGNHLFTRDYMTVKCWDFRMPSAPTQSINVNESIREYLPELYDNDVIFDKFSCRASLTGSEVITGSYGSQFAICNVKTRTSCLVSTLAAPGPNDALDFEKKVICVAWHPDSMCCAVAVDNVVTVLSRDPNAVTIPNRSEPPVPSFEHMRDNGNITMPKKVTTPESKGSMMMSGSNVMFQECQEQEEE